MSERKPPETPDWDEVVESFDERIKNLHEHVGHCATQWTIYNSAPAYKIVRQMANNQMAMMHMLQTVIKNQRLIGTKLSLTLGPDADQKTSDVVEQISGWDNSYSNQ